MRCRRCEEEIPDGSKICEYCGIFQDTFTKIPKKPDMSKQASKAKSNAAAFIVIAVIIIVVAVAANFFATKNKNDALDNIRTLYTQLANSEKQDKNDLAKFNALAGQFVVKYKKSGDEVEEVLKYHAEINKYNPEDFEDGKLPDKNDTEGNQAENVRILKFGSVRAEKRSDSNASDLIIKWANISDKTMAKVTFLIEAYDENGVIVKTASGKTRISASTTSGPFEKSADGQFYENKWVHAWPDGTVAVSAKVVGLTVLYKDGTSVKLDEKTAAALEQS